MNQIISILLLHFFTAPLERETFPVSYEFYHDSIREYRVEYKWESDEAIVATRRTENGEEGKTFLWLNDDFNVIGDSAVDQYGTPIMVGKYEYLDGKPIMYRSLSQVTYFSYSGGKLDSVAVKKDGTLIESYNYKYDSQGRLVQSDHFYDKGGLGYFQDNRSAVSYFLPDSIVVQYAFVPANGDSGKKRIYLNKGLPIKMVETEYVFSSNHINTHIWTFAPNVSVNRRLNNASPVLGWARSSFGRYNILGQRLSAGALIPRKY